MDESGSLIATRSHPPDWPKYNITPLPCAGITLAHKPADSERYGRHRRHHKNLDNYLLWQRGCGRKDALDSKKYGKRRNYSKLSVWRYKNYEWLLYIARSLDTSNATLDQKPCAHPSHAAKGRLKVEQVGNEEKRWCCLGLVHSRAMTMNRAMQNEWKRPWEKMVVDECSYIDEGVLEWLESVAKERRLLRRLGLSTPGVICQLHYYTSHVQFCLWVFYICAVILVLTYLIALNRSKLDGAHLQGLPRNIIAFHNNPTGVLLDWATSAFNFLYAVLCSLSYDE